MVLTVLISDDHLGQLLAITSYYSSLRQLLTTTAYDNYLR